MINLIIIGFIAIKLGWFAGSTAQLSTLYFQTFPHVISYLLRLPFSKRLLFLMSILSASYLQSTVYMLQSVEPMSEWRNLWGYLTPSKTERFKCSCRPGYTGNRCHEYPPIKSCRGYMRMEIVLLESSMFWTIIWNLSKYSVTSIRTCEHNLDANSVIPTRI